VGTTIFVFGSNLAGRHGKGAALEAYKKWGATYGFGVGRQGNSYAIPTKGYRLETLPLTTIRFFVQEFLEYALRMPGNVFKLTPIGCGLAGYSPEQIAPMFETAPRNIILPEEFLSVLSPGLLDENEAS
jgi:hypothetical protein